MIRKAVPGDLPEIERVMRAAMDALSTGFYDETQIRSAVEYIAVPDAQLVHDGTYFVVEESLTVSESESLRGDPADAETLRLCDSETRLVACGGWSARRKLFTGTSEQAAVEGMLDPASDAARIRAMFVDPSVARRGLGRLILETSEADAVRAGFRCFELMATLPGVPLYTACGYEEIARTVVELPDGVRLDGVVMHRCVK